MEILKWYGIILFSLSVIFNVIALIIDDDEKNRLKYVVSIIFEIPTLIYLIYK